MSDFVRASAPLLDEILGVRFDVLDHGFVRVVDYMGTDESILQAARVSYGKGTKKVREDRALIRYLMRHRHTTPFEMCEIKMHVKVPMDCWRQWIRHRTANVNEYSTRYSEAIDDTQTTGPTEWREQAARNKQGSAGLRDEKAGRHLTQREGECQRLAREVYEERLRMGVAREQARKDLPLSTYTEAYWKIDLHNLLHFLSLRMDMKAQHEIRSYATVLGKEVVSRWCPVAWEAFNDYRLDATLLTNAEAEVVRATIEGRDGDATSLAEQQGWLPRSEDGLLRRSREREELEAKLALLGLSAPWTQD